MYAGLRIDAAVARGMDLQIAVEKQPISVVILRPCGIAPDRLREVSLRGIYVGKLRKHKKEQPENEADDREHADEFDKARQKHPAVAADGKMHGSEADRKLHPCREPRAAVGDQAGHDDKDEKEKRKNGRISFPVLFPAHEKRRIEHEEHIILPIAEEIFGKQAAAGNEEHEIDEKVLKNGRYIDLHIQKTCDRIPFFIDRTIQHAGLSPSRFQSSFSHSAQILSRSRRSRTPTAFR